MEYRKSQCFGMTRTICSAPASKVPRFESESSHNDSWSAIYRISWWQKNVRLWGHAILTLGNPPFLNVQNIAIG